MAITKDNKSFLNLIGRSKEILDGWCRVGPMLMVHAQTQALQLPDLVEFGINKDRVAFIRLTKKGKKYIKPR